jgi:hypothetical protein
VVEARVSAAREFPGTRSRDLWVPRRARPCTTDDIEFHSLNLRAARDALDCAISEHLQTHWPADSASEFPPYFGSFRSGHIRSQEGILGRSTNRGRRT